MPPPVALVVANVEQPGHCRLRPRRSGRAGNPPATGAEDGEKEKYQIQIGIPP